jgi:hypothetical protein
VAVAQNHDEVVFVSTDGTFGRVDAMFMGRDILELDPIFEEIFVEGFRAFVVKDMEGRWMSLADQ